MKRLRQIVVVCCLISVCFSCVSNQGSSENRMIGSVDVYFLEDTRWFQRAYNRYTPLESEITSLQQLPSGIKVIFFGGLWQEQSQEALGKLYKAADMAGFEDNQIQVYFVDENLKSPEELEKSYQIALVPTYIIEQDGKEISRIEGVPQKPIEQVLLTTLEFEIPVSRFDPKPTAKAKDAQLVKNARTSRFKKKKW